MGTVPNHREPRTVLARPDDAVVIVRHDPTLTGATGEPASLALSVDHVPGGEPVPVILVGDKADLDLDGVLHGWLHGITTGGSR